MINVPGLSRLSHDVKRPRTVITAKASPPTFQCEAADGQQAGLAAIPLSCPAIPAMASGILVRKDQSDEPHEETQEERAVRSLQAIYGGADLTAESMQLANEFTELQIGRLKIWFRRWGVLALNRQIRPRPKVPYFTAMMSVSLMSGSLASRSGATWPSAAGI
jgi:hypothetical protein